MHCITASLPPEMVTALSVLFGNISLATCTLAPVTSRISLILLPPESRLCITTVGGVLTILTFSYERAALRGWNNQPQCDGRLRDPGRCDEAVEILLELVADESEGLEYRLAGAGHCHYPLRTRPVCDVDLGPALQHHSQHSHGDM